MIEITLVAQQARDVPELFCTEWFPHDVRPEYPGYYEVRNSVYTDNRHSAHLTGSPFRYWTGELWTSYQGDPTPSIFGRFETHQWRGLKKKYGSETELGLAVSDYYNNLNWKGNRELQERRAS